LAALAGVGGFAASSGGRVAPPADGVEVLGLILLAVALVFRFAPLVSWAVIAAAAGYLAGREGHASVDGWAALVGALLLLAAELATWSIDVDARIHTERALMIRRTLTLAGLFTSVLLVNFLLLAASALTASAGVLLAVLGTGAAVAAVAVVLRLARGTTA
jgi:hypothetical protein